MDDLDPDHKVLKQQLKIWADRYGCVLETKGGAVTDRYEKFVVTSQYSIEEIWADDYKTQAAIRRRFNVIHMVDPFTVAQREVPLHVEEPLILDNDSALHSQDSGV